LSTAFFLEIGALHRGIGGFYYAIFNKSLQVFDETLIFGRFRALKGSVKSAKKKTAFLLLFSRADAILTSTSRGERQLKPR